MDFLSVRGLIYQYDDRNVVDEVSFESPAFRRLAIAGETGSGKTSLLKLIGGLLQPTAGAIYFRNKRVPGAAEQLIPGHPEIAYLSQHFELHNNYRVYDILDYANRLEGGLPQHILRLCRVDHLLQRKTDQLSGGERQRIALARQLLRGPRLLLLDEPFSNLDGFHRDQLWEVLEEMQQQLDCTCILVSHDPTDSLAWADDIIVLQEGRLVQRGSPTEIYHYPVNRYVARLFGKYNLFSTPLGRRLVRPEHLEPLTGAHKAGLEAILQQAHFLGAGYEWVLQHGEEKIFLRTGMAPPPTGSRVLLGIKSSAPRSAVADQF